MKNTDTIYMLEDLDSVILINFSNSVERMQNNPLITGPIKQTIASSNSKNGIHDYLYFRALISDIRPLFYSESEDESNISTIRRILKKYKIAVANQKETNILITEFKISPKLDHVFTIGNLQLTQKEVKDILLYGEGIHYQKIKLLEKWYAIPETIRHSIYVQYAYHIKVDLLPILVDYKILVDKMFTDGIIKRYEGAHVPELY